jgi:hypothetical protein
MIVLIYSRLDMTIIYMRNEAKEVPETFYHSVMQSHQNGTMSVSLPRQFCTLANIEKKDVLSMDILNVHNSVCLMVRKT